MQLSNLIAEPALAATLSTAEIAQLLGECEAARSILAAALAARTVAPTTEAAGITLPSQDQLLTVEEAARVLAVSPEWLYRRYKRLGIGLKLGDGTLRFSRSAIEAYIRHHKIDAVPIRRRKAV